MKILTHSVGVVAFVHLFGCSAADPGGASTAPFANAGAAGIGGASGAAGVATIPMQMGNGPPGQGGSSGMVVPPNGGASVGGALGAGGTITGAAGVVGVAGSVASGGTLGSGGTFGGAGMFGSAGTLGSGGMFGAGGVTGTGGLLGMSGGTGLGGMSSGGDAETGRMIGMTAAHNAIRAAVNAQPPLPPLTWSSKIAMYAQQWADNLAQTACQAPYHRSESQLIQVGYGENLAAFGSTRQPVSTADQAANGWGAEKACYTFGKFNVSDKCDTTCYMNLMSDGCGHYTQEVWRSSTQLGCGVASCQDGVFQKDIWICNYAPAGNYVGQAPY